MLRRGSILVVLLGVLLPFGALTAASADARPGYTAAEVERGQELYAAMQRASDAAAWFDALNAADQALVVRGMTETVDVTVDMPMDEPPTCVQDVCAPPASTPSPTCTGTDCAPDSNDASDAQYALGVDADPPGDAGVLPSWELVATPSPSVKGCGGHEFVKKKTSILFRSTIYQFGQYIHACWNTGTLDPASLYHYPIVSVSTSLWACSVTKERSFPGRTSYIGRTEGHCTFGLYKYGTLQNTYPDVTQSINGVGAYTSSGTAN